MSGGLQTFEPDHLYCVYCHAEAAGPCATCQAMICGDCSVLSGGSVKIVAVCKRCDAQGRGRVGWRAWLGILAPIVVVLVVLVVLVSWLQS